MATGDINDPAKMASLAQEQLRATMERLDEHIQALTRPTAELALSAQKRAAEGAEEVEPASLMRRYVSSAKTPGVGAWVPGGLNEAADSTPEKARQAGMTPSQRKAFAETDVGELAKKEVTIPQFGDWQVDSLLKLASEVAAKHAKSQYEKSNEGLPPTQTPEEWMKGQGRFASSSLAGTLSTGAQIAAGASLFHKKILSPIADIGFGASNMGASLGFSPQEGALGMPSHILGIPNPIAAFTSPAGKQGMGMLSNAFQASVMGTGIGFGEAEGLRGALAAQGWHNTRGGGGFLGLNWTEGGANETLARALEPMMKQGVKNPEVLSEFSDAVRLGTASVQELQESLGGSRGLSETAQNLNKTVEQTAVALQEFAAKSVEGGSTMVHGFQTGREVANLTGMNPNIVSGINNSNFGRVQALQGHILPWQIEGMSGPAKAQNALETVQKVMKFVPKNLKPIERTNVNGEKEVVESVEEQKMAWLHQLDPNITNEQAKHLLSLQGKLPFLEAGEHQGSNVEKFRLNAEKENQRHGTWAPDLAAMQARFQSQQNRVKALKEHLKDHPDDGNFANVQAELYEAEEAEGGTKSKLSDLLKKSTKQKALKPEQEAKLNQMLGGEKGLFETAYKGGVNLDEIKRIHGLDPAAQAKELRAAMHKVAQVNIEKKEEENAKIELAGPAAYLFKLKFPKVSKFLEQNAGGAHTSQNSGEPNSATSPASQQAIERGAEKAARAE